MSYDFGSVYLYVGGYGTGNQDDFTDRMLGFTIEQRIVPQQINTFTCEITLNNDDGAFTPRAGGTYEDYDWFNRMVGIVPYDSNKNVYTTDDASLFLGFVDNFELLDDGTSSTITLSCVDVLTFASRSPSVSQIWSGSTGTQYQMIDSALLRLTTDFYGGTAALPIPPGWANDAHLDLTNVSDGNVSMVHLDTDYIDTSGTIGDVLNQSLLPSDWCVIWPTNAYRKPLDTDVYYTVNFIGRGGLREPFDDATPDEYVFVEGSPSTDEIPFSTIDTGYRLEDLVNSIEATNAPTSSVLDAYDTTSIGLYGAANANFGELACSTDAYAQESIDNIVNRFATPRFFPRSIQITRGNIQSVIESGDVTAQSIRAAFFKLLGLQSLWTKASVTYTPTGSSTTLTDQCVISGRIIEATPGDMRVTIELLPAVDYQSFVLDSDVLGVLDQNRLG